MILVCGKGGRKEEEHVVVVVGKSALLGRQ